MKSPDTNKNHTRPKKYWRIMNQAKVSANDEKNPHRVMFIALVCYRKRTYYVIMSQFNVRTYSSMEGYDLPAHVKLSQHKNKERAETAYARLLIKRSIGL